MKKLIVILSCLLVLGGMVSAQSMYGDAVKADVKMKYVYSFEEALKKSKETKKPIFFNCFADWALPCHGMNKYVFSDQEFADWMDKHFVNFFMDVTTPEGRPLSDKYNTKSMAHYLVLDSDGNVIHRIVGGCRLPEFKERVACALSPETSQTGMGIKYDKGERGVKFLGQYARALKYSDKDERYGKVSNEYFAKLKKSEWPKKENWALFRDKVRDPEGEMFQYLIDRKTEFAKNNGDSIINTLISGVYFYPVYQFASGDIKYDGAKLLEIYMVLKKADIPEDNPIYVVYDIARYRGERNFDKMMEVFEQKISKLDERTAVALDMSLKNWKELSVEEKKRITTYLNQRAEKAQGNLKEMYQETTKEMVNPEGIPFEELSFEEALEKTRKENKLLFVDCYTSWCGPCKMMSKQVFSLKFIGDYFKEHFVSLKIDMERGEGPELAKKYGVKAYPTMLILDPEGVVKYKLLGGMGPRSFMDKIQMGMEPGISYTELKKKYENGDRSPVVVSEYLITMNDAGDLKDKYNEPREFLNSLQGDDRFSVSAWKIYDVFETDYKSPEFKFLAENRKRFISQVDEKVVNKKIEQVIFPVVLSYLKGENPKAELERVQELIRLAGFPADFSLTLLDRIMELYVKDDFSGIVKFYEDTIAQLPNGHTRLNLDVILYLLLDKAPVDVRKSALAYVKKTAETVNENAKNSYTGLIQKLSE